MSAFKNTICGVVAIISFIITKHYTLAILVSIPALMAIISWLIIKFRAKEWPTDAVFARNGEETDVEERNGEDKLLLGETWKLYFQAMSHKSLHDVPNWVFIVNILSMMISVIFLIWAFIFFVRDFKI